MEERFQQGLQRALDTPPQHRQSVRPKPKERGANIDDGFPELDRIARALEE
jgi:hypothetical protein